MTRLPHWDTHGLPDFLAHRRRVPFKWGAHDCSLFAADAVQAITGVDIAAAFRGRYSTEAGAWELIKQVTGGATVADAAEWCARQHGLPEYQHPLCARRGDLVVVRNDDRLIAGVVHTDGRHAVSVGEGGLLYLPLRCVARAWQV